MSDELDPLLLRHFAEHNHALPDGGFSAQVLRQLSGGSSRRAFAVLGTIARGVGASAALLRSGYGRVMLLGAAALTLWAGLA